MIIREPSDYTKTCWGRGVFSRTHSDCDMPTEDGFGSNRLLRTHLTIRTSTDLQSFHETSPNVSRTKRNSANRTTGSKPSPRQPAMPFTITISAQGKSIFRDRVIRHCSGINSKDKKLILNFSRVASIQTKSSACSK